jgi:Glu-tRNA(Gln) amidotransferase subunit E-like FAD-binding protein
MLPARKQFLDLLTAPGRLRAQEVEWRLGMSRQELQVVTSIEHIEEVRNSLPKERRHQVLSGQTRLKPLGNPSPAAEKFFLETEITQLEGDLVWLDKAVRTGRLHLRLKKARLKGKAKLNEEKTEISNTTTDSESADLGTGI